MKRGHTLNSKEQDRFVFDVRKTQNAEAFNGEGYFFRDLLNKAISIIRSQVQEIENMSKEKALDQAMYHAHEAITILGSRGTGKTTFLLTITEAVRQDASLKQKVHVLPVLDPTVIEQNEIFIATVISNILGELEKIKNQDKKDFKAVDEALSHLSSAIPILATRGSYQWPNDPELFANALLQASFSGLKLAKRFNEFVVAAAAVLGVKAFIQPIDDVDVAAGNAKMVLETLRKYLASKHFIAIVTGDIQLFRIVVRAFQWEHFSDLVRREKDLNNSEYLAESKISTEITRLEFQYLTKVLPETNRLTLPSIAESIWRGQPDGERIDIVARSQKEENKQITFSQLYKNILEDLFGYPPERFSVPNALSLNPNQIPETRLLPPNARNFFRFLHSLSEWCDGPPEDRKAAILGLRQSLSHVFDRRGIPFSLVDDLLQSNGYHWLSNLLMNNSSKAPNLYQLEPNYQSIEEGPEWNQFVLMTQILINESWRNHPLGDMSLWCKVFLPGVTQEESTKKETDLSELFGLYDSEPPSKTASRYIVTRFSGTYYYRDLGILRVLGRLRSEFRHRWNYLLYLHEVKFKKAELEKKLGEENQATIYSKTLENTKKSIKLISKEVGLWPWIAFRLSESGINFAERASLKKEDTYFRDIHLERVYKAIDNSNDTIHPLLLYRLTQTTIANAMQRFFFVNIHRLLSCITQLTMIGLENRHDPSAVLKNTLIELTLEAEQFVPYTFQTGQTEEDEDGEISENEAEPSENSWNQDLLVNDISTWITEIIDPLTAKGSSTSLMYSRVFRRYYGNLHAINGETRDYTYSVGISLEHWYLSFLHAFLLEEVSFRNPSLLRSLNLEKRNTVKSTDYFFKNLEKLAEDPSTLFSNIPVTLMWLLCPLGIGLYSDYLNLAKTWKEAPVTDDNEERTGSLTTIEKLKTILKDFNINNQPVSTYLEKQRSHWVYKSGKAVFDPFTLFCGIGLPIKKPKDMKKP